MKVQPQPPWGFRARVVKVHDGDSLFVLCDTGFGGRHEVELRLLDVHAPELHQLGGAEATAFVQKWIETVTAASQRTWPLWISVLMTSTYEPNMRQTFTRYACTVWSMDAREAATDKSLNQAVCEFLSQHPEWPTGL